MPNSQAVFNEFGVVGKIPGSKIVLLKIHL